MTYYSDRNRLYTFSAIAQCGLAVYRNDDGTYRIEGYGTRKAETNLQPSMDELTTCILKSTGSPAWALKQVRAAGWPDLSAHFQELYETELSNKKTAVLMENERKAKEYEERLRQQECPLFQLQQMAEHIRCGHAHWLANSTKNYWDWRKVIGDKQSTSPNYDPEDVSVRNLHYAALSAIKSIEDFETTVEKLHEFVKQKKQEAGARRDTSVRNV